MGAGTAAGMAMAGAQLGSASAPIGAAVDPRTLPTPNYGSPADYGNNWQNVPGAETGGFTGQTPGMGMGGGGIFGGGSFPFSGGFGMMGGNVAGGMQGGGGQQQQAWSPGSKTAITADQVVKQYGADPSVAQYWADKINTGGDPNYYIGRLKDDNAGTGPDAPGGLDSGKGSGSGSQQPLGSPQMQLGGFRGSNMSFSPMGMGGGRAPIRGYTAQPGGLASYVQAAGGNLGGGNVAGSGYGMQGGGPQFYGGTFAQMQPQGGNYGSLTGGVGQTGAGLGMFGLPQMQQGTYGQ